MRDLPPAFAAQLATGATTHCRCWRIDRRFGDPLGFTDHDRDIAFGGVVFEAASGFTAQDAERSLGLAVDNGSATGALRSEKITDADIRSGAYDGVTIRQWTVDWRDPANRLLTFRGEIGEIQRGENAFEVEMRGLSEPLTRPIGRSYVHVCDAKLGDGKCGVDLSSAAFRGTGSVIAVEDGRTITVSGLSGFDEAWFDDGLLRWTSGGAQGREAAVATHRTGGGDVVFTFQDPVTPPPEVGASFEAFAGCDKRIETCRDKFQNVLNFRGFPFIPGDSWVAAYPVEGGVYDGGSRG
ncbi:MAG: DUF2163 domain-containing protein [Pseudomonadota bacterium]